ncbi:MAG TPA: cation:proton antiporter [Burkholderiaceae bacterium]|nr:cation:proton antiporter [Burkholderiaceae bacterium]
MAVTEGTLLQNFAESTNLVWPLAVACAWLLGELIFRATRLPRISTYGLVGFGLSYAQLGVLPRPSESAMMLMANIALGLILFEFGYRTNLRWLRINFWVGVSGLLESLATFAAVYFTAQAFGAGTLTAALLAALAMATSPAEVLRVVNEQRSAGQVTERAMHLSALNCVLSVVIFNAVVGFWAFRDSGSLWHAASSSVVVFGVSVALGAAFGIVLPALLRVLGRLEQTATIGFAVGVLVLVAFAHALKMSPVLAALTFGFVVRHRRVTLNPAQRNFGALGDLLCVLLFVFIGATLAWPRVMSGLGLAMAIVAVRFLTKVVGSLLLAHVSGISWRKGSLAGLALSPMSALVMALLVQTRYMGINLMEQLAALAGATLVLGIAGPLLTQLALKWAHEVPEAGEG